MSALLQAQWVPVQQREKLRYAGNSTVSVERQPLFRLNSELTPVVQYEGDGWLFSALAELHALKRAGMNIPGLGDFRIADETMDRVRRLLTTEAVLNLDKPQFVPFSGGGLSLVWNSNNQELTFSVYPGEEQATYMTGAVNAAEQNDGVVAVTNNTDLSAIVTRFLTTAG